MKYKHKGIEVTESKAAYSAMIDGKLVTVNFDPKDPSAAKFAKGDLEGRILDSKKAKDHAAALADQEKAAKEAKASVAAGRKASNVRKK